VTPEFIENSESATEAPPSFPTTPLLIAIACAVAVAIVIGVFAVYRTKRKTNSVGGA
jgi:ABC-type antimicrobial peptide transport system permease subunit